MTYNKEVAKVGMSCNELQCSRLCIEEPFSSRIPITSLDPSLLSLKKVYLSQSRYLVRTEDGYLGQ